MRTKNLIWDFDGTLFDSYPHIIRAFRRAMERKGCSEISLEEITEKVRVSTGFAVRFYSERYGLEADELLRIYHEEEDGKDDADVLPFCGVLKFLQETRAIGWHHFLYTHRGPNAFVYLDRCKARNLFDGFVTAADGFPSKPAPDAILFLIGEYDLKKDDTWMIGDRIIDAQAGKNAGISSLLFDPEYRISDTEGFPLARKTEEIRKFMER